MAVRSEGCAHWQLTEGNPHPRNRDEPHPSLPGRRGRLGQT